MSKVLAKIIDPNTPDVLLGDWHRYNGQLTTEDEKDELVDNAILLLEKIGNNSESRVVLGALLCKSLRQKTLRALSASRYVRAAGQAQSDFRTIVHDGKVPRRFATRCRVKPAAIKELVRWILTDDNVQLLSWAKKKARTDDGRQDITCVSRKKTKLQMWRDYLRSHENLAARVGKTSFMLIVGEITGKQQKSVKAVDYLVAELVHQNRARLERMVHRSCTKDVAEALIKEMRKVFSFAKSSFARRIGSSTCASHSAQFALGIDGGESGALQPVTDQETAAIFHWFEERLKKEVPGQHQLIDESVHKLKIFLGHALRTNVQQQAIAKAHSELRENPTKCIMLADYKMKIEPSQRRESTVEHYGKRGISYHGICVYYMHKRADGKLEPTIRYIDTVVEGDASQDIGAALSILEEALVRTRSVLPDYVTSFIFQSDNARTYQNLCLPLLLPELGQRARLRCGRILHTETQDGKSIIDAHFQKVNAKIDTYIAGEGGWQTYIVKACTADQICMAISSADGIPGTDLTVLRLDRSKLQSIEDQRDEIASTTALLLPGMILDIRYSEGEGPDTAHATSISPALQVQRSKSAASRASKLSAHLATATLRIDMAALTTLHRKFDTNFEVEKIIDERQSEEGDETEYLVRWKGYGVDEDQWLSAESLSSAPLIVSAWNGEQQQGSQSHSNSESDSDSDDDDDIVQPCYCSTGVLPVTGAQILRNEGWQCVQKPGAAFQIGDASSDDDEEEDSEDSDDEDSAPKKMDVLAQAVREFLLLVDQPETGIATPDKQTISQLLPANPERATIQFASGWARRPAHGYGKGETYMCEDFLRVVTKLFNRGEKKKGCKYSAHQMHAEIERRFPDRFDIPSVTEIAAAVANLVMGKKTGKKISAVGGGRGRRTTEQKFPEVFGPLWAEWTAGREQTVRKACSWLNQHKHGQISGSWPQELSWPHKQKTHVAAALKRFHEGRAAPVCSSAE